MDSVSVAEHEPLIRQLWAHHRSGDVYVVELRGSTVVAASGPLHYSEQGAALQAGVEYDPDVTAAVAADQESYRYLSSGLYRCLPDDEYDSVEWWAAAVAADLSALSLHDREIVERVLTVDDVLLTAAQVDAVTSWARSLPGYADGPEYAPEALLFVPLEPAEYTVAVA